MKCSVCGTVLLNGQDGRGAVYYCPACGCVRGGKLQPEPSPASKQLRKALKEEGTDLEQAFRREWAENQPQMPTPEREFKFHPVRNFELDFAWPDVKVVVECEGCKHRIKDRFARDVEKYNLLAAAGYVLFRCTTKTLRDTPAQFCQLVADAIKERIAKL